MARKLSISNQNKSIEDILEWYRVTRNSLDENEKLIVSNQNSTIQQFIGLTQQEVEEYFEYAKDELEKLRGLQVGTVLELTGTVIADDRAPGGA